MATQKPIASTQMQMQTPEQIAQKRIHQQTSQRREHQRRKKARESFVHSLAAFIECSPADVPRYAKNHGIPLYQG